MADDVRETKADLEAGFAVAPLAARETKADLEVAFSLDQNPGNVHETKADLEAGFAVVPRDDHTTDVYLEAAFSLGPPPGDFIRDTDHYVEVAFRPVFAEVPVGCPEVQGEHAGAEAIQGGVC